MTENASEKWIYSSNFEERFAARINHKDFFNLVESELKTPEGWDKHKDHFPGLTATPFRGELKRWIDKVAPDRIKRHKDRKETPSERPFHGTLKQLQIYCKLFGITPDQVLEPESAENISGKNATQIANVFFLYEEDIIEICRVLKENPYEFDKTIWPVLLPVMYAPDNFAMLYLKIYKQNQADSFFSISFVACDFNQNYITGDNDICFFSSWRSESVRTLSSSLVKILEKDYKTGVNTVQAMNRSSRTNPHVDFGSALSELLKLDGISLSGCYFKEYPVEEEDYSDMQIDHKAANRIMDIDAVVDEAYCKKFGLMGRK